MFYFLNICVFICVIKSYFSVFDGRFFLKEKLDCLTTDGKSWTNKVESDRRKLNTNRTCVDINETNLLNLI